MALALELQDFKSSAESGRGLARTSGRSLTWISTGPRTEPWGTPMETGTGEACMHYNGFFLRKQADTLICNTTALTLTHAKRPVEFSRSELDTVMNLQTQLLVLLHTSKRLGEFDGRNIQAFVRTLTRIIDYRTRSSAPLLTAVNENELKQLTPICSKPTGGM
ncbi:hypothetical protein T265_07521 [Opisthorchis viverrini]|uniref:Uncharacterized protein n=1 Tax=Opisthorchis viverrini TaxID=6198 RepID=A0A074ZC57_OPIVI|nr:hypothetical protein T265_07521 [Opisthorchis viverrini]KER24896.1 hypothetical protein T265_07521 [Opisthorchis viverrini]